MMTWKTSSIERLILGLLSILFAIFYLRLFSMNYNWKAKRMLQLIVIDTGNIQCTCLTRFAYYRALRNICWSFRLKMMSTWPDMKMGGKPLGPPISSSNCFSGRYSPTYRVPEHQMRRCVTNPPVIYFTLFSIKKNLSNLLFFSH